MLFQNLFLFISLQGISPAILHTTQAALLASIHLVPVHWYDVKVVSRRRIYGYPDTCELTDPNAEGKSDIGFVQYQRKIC